MSAEHDVGISVAEHMPDLLSVEKSLEGHETLEVRPEFRDLKMSTFLHHASHAIYSLQVRRSENVASKADPTAHFQQRFTNVETGILPSRIERQNRMNYQCVLQF